MAKGFAQRGTCIALLLAACFALAASGLLAQGAPPAPPLPAPPTPDQTASGSPVPSALAPGAAVSPPAWEAVAIKPANPNEMNSMLRFTPDGFGATHVSLQMIVREAFGEEDDHILNEPGWVKTAMFDIEAKVSPEDAPNLKGLSFDQRRAMLVPLLQERFGLKFHHETRELPVYELVVAKGGVKMEAAKPDPPKQQDPGPGSGPGSGAGPGAGPSRGRMLMNGRGHLESTGTGMKMLASTLSRQLGRTVIDETGLTGNYDYKLDWTPDDATPAMAKADSAASGDDAPGSTGPSLLTAVQEQLGLKLEASKGQADVIVIDQIQQPSPN